MSSAGVPRTHLAPITARYPESFVSTEASAPSASAAAASGAAPASFDLRDAGKLSLVRDQGRYGTCWAFASLASLESSLLPGAATDYSENNLAQRSGFALGYDSGGNSFMAAAYLLRWDGPVAEADDPYAPDAATPNASPADATVRAHVHEVLDLPARKTSADNADLKWAVMTYGAVYTTMYWTSSAYRDATDAYYYTGAGANHAVDVVGWDDAYPAAAFAATPAGPGAFLVRNSWGTDFGSDGYFWVSYYDASFGRQSAVFAGAEPAGADERIYQHDPLGWVASYRPPAAADPTTAWFAAAYTPAEDGTLTAAGFYATAPGATYEVRVAESVAGVRDAAVAASGTLAAAGYHTVTTGLRDDGDRGAAARHRRQADHAGLQLPGRHRAALRRVRGRHRRGRPELRERRRDLLDRHDGARRRHRRVPQGLRGRAGTSPPWTRRRRRRVRRRRPRRAGGVGARRLGRRRIRRAPRLPRHPSQRHGHRRRPAHAADPAGQGAAQPARCGPWTSRRATPGVCAPRRAGARTWWRRSPPSTPGRCRRRRPPPCASAEPVGAGQTQRPLSGGRAAAGGLGAAAPAAY